MISSGPSAAAAAGVQNAPSCLVKPSPTSRSVSSDAEAMRAGVEAGTVSSTDEARVEIATWGAALQGAAEVQPVAGGVAMQRDRGGVGIGQVGCLDGRSFYAELQQLRCLGVGLGEAEPALARFLLDRQPGEG